MIQQDKKPFFWDSTTYRTKKAKMIVKSKKRNKHYKVGFDHEIFFKKEYKALLSPLFHLIFFFAKEEQSRWKKIFRVFCKFGWKFQALRTGLSALRIEEVPTVLKYTTLRTEGQALCTGEGIAHRPRFGPTARLSTALRTGLSTPDPNRRYA